MKGYVIILVVLVTAWLIMDDFYGKKHLDTFVSTVFPMPANPPAIIAWLTGDSAQPANDARNAAAAAPLIAANVPFATQLAPLVSWMFGGTNGAK